MTGQPDFATVTITYVPDAVDRRAQVAQALPVELPRRGRVPRGRHQPHPRRPRRRHRAPAMTVHTDWNVRGGIATEVTAVPPMTARRSSSCSGGLDSATVLAIALDAGLRVPRAQLPLRPAPRGRARRGRRRSRRPMGVDRPRRRRHRPAGVRRLGAHRRHRRCPRAATRRRDGRRHPGHLRPGPQHDLPVLRAGLGRGARGAPTSSSASTRSTTAATPTAGPSTSRPSRPWPTWPRKAGVEGEQPVTDPHAARSS